MKMTSVLVTAGGRRAKGKGKGGRIQWKGYIFMYENGTMRPVETVLRRVGGRRKMEGMNVSKYVVSSIVNMTMYPQYNYNMLINKIKVQIQSLRFKANS
jgi:hypothetical protein